MMLSDEMLSGAVPHYVLCRSMAFFRGYVVDSSTRADFAMLFTIDIDDLCCSVG